MLKGFNKQDKERQIRPILARQVWLNESAAQAVPCGRDLSLAVAFVEKKLTKKERQDFQSHLLDCRHCRQFVSSEVRLQRPVFESPVVAAISRESFFSKLRFQWVAVAAGLVLAAGLSAFLVVNHDSRIGQQSPVSQNNNIAAPVVTATNNNNNTVPVRAVVPQAPLRSATAAAVVLNGTDSAPALPTSIDLGGLAGGSGSSPATLNSATNSTVNTSLTTPEVKKDLQENAFNVDGSTVNAIANAVSGMVNPPVPVTGEKDSSEYRVRVESANLDSKPVVPPTRTTELKTELISTNLGDLDQASINVPSGGNGFVSRNSEIVIISHPLVPWTTAVNRPPVAPGTEELISKRSPYNQSQTKVAFAGKLFNQVDKVWIDQEFAASSNLPIVKVKVKSPEGKELLAANPGLKPFFSMHRQIVVVYEGKVYMTY